MSPVSPRTPSLRCRALTERSIIGRSSALKLLIVLLFAGVFWTDSAHAYAWMIRHDYTACGTCHADPSGGELLTTYGRVTSDLILSMNYGGSKDESAGGASKEEGPQGGLFWDAVELPQWLLLSGSYRNLYVVQPTSDDKFTFVPVMQADAYGQLRFGDFTMGGSLGMGKVSVGEAEHVRAAQVTHAQDDSINLISRTYYLGYDIGSEFVVRAGRLNLPFGLRIPEHTAWVREATRTDRESDQQVGAALSYVGNHFRAEIMGIAGNYQIQLDPGPPYDDLTADAVRERGYSTYAEGIAGTSFAAGVTSKVTYAKLDRLNYERDTLRQAHGITARWAAHKTLSFMGEFDALFRSRADAGYVGFLQGDWEPIQGLHFILTGEVQDQGMLVQTEGEPPPVPQYGVGAPQLGGWFSIDWFFFRQFELRTDLVFRQEDPFTMLGQLHFYL